MSKSVRLLNNLFPVHDWLYILQLEEYNHRRYWQHIVPRLFKRNFEQRDTLIFTTRIKLVLVAALVITAIPFWFVSGLGIVVYLLFLPSLAAFYVGLASVLITPLATILRQQTIARARTFFAQTYPDTKVIGITGSYGKTTTKYLLEAMLKHSYRTAIVPENINTTLGIANHLLKENIPTNTDYLIVEMGAYVRGDIAECADMLPPDISIITILGDQHLERFGSFRNLVLGKTEIFNHAKADAYKITTEAALEHMKREEVATTDVHTVAVAEGATSNIALATAVATHLGISDSFIADTIAKFTPPERRDNTYISHGVTVIDNSYNISPQTAEKMLQEAAAHATVAGKQLVVMTAGIGEQGIDSEHVNSQFADLLNQYATRAIIHPSVYASIITKNLIIPYIETPQALPVLEKIQEHINGSTEILLHFPEHSDAAYF